MEIRRLTRGKPLGSAVRQNIINILYLIKEGYGNDIHKIYCEVFPKVSKNTIYYHLRKGTNLEIFAVKKIVNEQGEFSWGPSTEKTYYGLGKQACPAPEPRISDYLDKRCKK